MVILSNCQIVILVFYGGMVHNKKKINIYIYFFLIMGCFPRFVFDNLTI